ncbi:MAG: acetylxylan esterase [Bryobacterales bacterium]|nr:acetylxylan esterase [Bryobacterales bacterium]
MKFLVLPLLLACLPLFGQSTPSQVQAVLEPHLGSPDLVAHELRQYLQRKAPALPAAKDARQWTAEAAALRARMLREVVYHGWPREWVDAPPRFEDLGPIPAGKGYRMRKLRYEIVPGFASSAVLYEPENAGGKMPAILNVNGHVGAPGKAVEYKQKRCINQARQGILALNLEWMSFGELSHPENVHWFGAHLDLAGANALGLFYLAMRRGLDYLYERPDVDRKRIGVTGLSGGGWQTIVLSSLDDRVAVSVPVAGYSAFVSRVERAADTGDLEQNATDLLTVADYPHLTAMRAPRPTLLIYNAEDDCCFRAPLVKPYIFDRVLPFFRLHGAEGSLAWHENTDPSDHNYQLDNRQQSYRFFTTHFGLPAAREEIPADGEIRTVEELSAGLPEDNLTILGLAKQLAGRIQRPSTPSAVQRGTLRETVRYRPVAVRHAWASGNTKSKGLETQSYRLEFDNGLSAAGVLLRALAAGGTAPATIVVHDAGKQAAADPVSERVNRGEQVLALDLLFTGDAAPAKPGPHLYAQMLATLGERPLGMEAAQLIAAGRWLRESRRPSSIRLETSGPRSQVTALVAAALEPGLFSEAAARDGLSSLRLLLDKPVAYTAAPDLFCLDLYRHFDIDSLSRLAFEER